MAIQWLKGFIVPLVQIIFLGGIIIFIIYVIARASYRTWKKQTKFFVKYSILRNQYPKSLVEWCVKCMENGIGYYDAKKLLLVQMMPSETTNEILYIYDQIIKKTKGGLMKKNVRNIKGNDSQNQGTTKLPTI